jgi:ABC-2 type transport system permease protein
MDEGVSMGNVIRIARKEFADLLGNRIVFLFLAIFAVIIILSAQELGDYLSCGHVMWDMYGNSVSNLLLGSVLTPLTYFGGFVGVIVGFSIFASDRYNYSLNTLLVKPLYRDSIIYGKLLAALGFLACICGFTKLQVIK